MPDLTEALRPYASLLVAAARRYKLSPQLLAGLVAYESGGNPTIRSKAGAVGLGQVMPREAGAQFRGRPTARELEDPATNLEWAARILSEGITRWGTVEQGLGAYLGTIDGRGRVTGSDPYTGVTGTQYVQQIQRLAADVGERLLRATAGTAEAAPGEGAPAGAPQGGRAMSPAAETWEYQPPAGGTEGPPVPVRQMPFDYRSYLRDDLRSLNDRIADVQNRMRDLTPKAKAIQAEIAKTRDASVKEVLRQQMADLGTSDSLQAELKGLQSQRSTAILELGRMERDAADAEAKAGKPETFGGQQTGLWERNPQTGQWEQRIPGSETGGGAVQTAEEAALLQARTATEGAQAGLYGAQAAKAAVETKGLLAEMAREQLKADIAQQWSERQQQLVRQLSDGDEAQKREALMQLYDLAAFYQTPDGLASRVSKEADRRLEELDLRMASEGVVYNPLTMEPLLDEQGQPRRTEAARAKRAEEDWRQQSLEVSRRNAATEEGQLEVERSKEQRSVAQLVGALGSQAHFAAVQQRPPHVAGEGPAPQVNVPGDQSEPVGMRILRQLGINPDQLGLLRGGGRQPPTKAQPASPAMGPPAAAAPAAAAEVAPVAPPGPAPSAAASLVQSPAAAADEGTPLPEAGPEAGVAEEEAPLAGWQTLLAALDEEEERRRRAAA